MTVILDESQIYEYSGVLNLKVRHKDFLHNKILTVENFALKQCINFLLLTN
jgi:hypothetical protein